MNLVIENMNIYYLKKVIGVINLIMKIFENYLSSLLNEMFNLRFI